MYTRINGIVRYTYFRSSSACRYASSSTSESVTRVCVVGTGPGGFYTAKYLLKEDPSVHVDLIDALPTPFGLVRTGVAPDHPEVKSVQNDFTQVASDPRVAFLGNVKIGWDLPVSELRRYYNAVVLAYGAASDRMLHIPGESLHTVCSARAFVNWYNGHPDFRNFSPDLQHEDAVIIGQGNVAVDCARILSRTVEELKATDIAEHAVEALAKSKIKRVHVVGRRGHVQAAFTMKELRELIKLSDVDVVVDEKELQRGRNASSEQEMQTHRARKRMDALLTEAATTPLKNRSRQVFLRFLLSPLRILPASGDVSRVGAVECAVNELSGPADGQIATMTDERETIPAGLVLRSIGYKSISVPGVPFDDKKAVVRNNQGRVVEADGTQVIGVYVSGWLKRGPSGIIGTNIPDARETVACILADKAANKLAPIAAPQAGLSGLRAALIAAGKNPTEMISWQDYCKIDQSEVERGRSAGKPREKITDVAEMIKVARNATTEQHELKNA